MLDADSPLSLQPGDILKDLKLCSDEMYKSRQTTDSILQLGISGLSVDRETLVQKPFGFPDMHVNRFLAASNIGLVDGVDPAFRLFNPPSEGYWVVIDGYHTKETFYMVLVWPETLPADLVRLIKGEIDAIMGCLMELNDSK
eukprot:gnl/Chilomastix_caulleri/2774.p1 GENE.gnl/Chilomastix_caulleri/2774~~gnl/Chilomastix_caulleri/2774.p1  ORF type:complete len:142 (+),score=14.30 gnl/Chilomastix_caulleri/2774:417-842(+)